MSFNTGDHVLVKNEDGYWYPGRISSINTSSITVKLENGKTSKVSKDLVHPYDWKIGQRANCNWKLEGTYYWGMISKFLPDGSFWIVYDDGDLEKTTLEHCRCKE